MARAITWAVRLLLTDGRTVFVRTGGIGSGQILTRSTKEQAEALATIWRFDARAKEVTVIERSHGRQESQA